MATSVERRMRREMAIQTSISMRGIGPDKTLFTHSSLTEESERSGNPMSIRNETGQKGSVTEPRRALQHFTNRTDAIRHFAKYLNDDPAQKKILFFHGDGGNGKTLLLRFLKERCSKCLDADNWGYIKGLEGNEFIGNFTQAEGVASVPSTLIDFAMEPRGEYKPKESFSALMKMRRDLSGQGLWFPFYDFACVLYLHKTGHLTKERLKDLFPQDDLDLVTTVADAVSTTSWGALAKSVLGLFNKHLQERFTLYQYRKKIDEEQVRELERMDAESELYVIFPELFADDLNASMTLPDAPQRVALFFDTHEAFWEISDRRFSDEKYFIADEWLRGLLCRLELNRGIVAVVAGRERPRWADATKETIPVQHIDMYPVEGFSTADAASYLDKVEITGEEMKESLLSCAEVKPNDIHPLYLGLCADIVLAAKESGQGIVADEFREIPDIAGKGKALMDRLRKYVDGPTGYAISALSACRSFDRDLYVSLMEELRLSFSRESFDYLTRFSFIWDSEERGQGWYRIHDLMRRLAYEQKEATTFEAHQFLAQYYRTQGEQGDLAAIVETVYHVNRVDAAEGARQWLSEMERALSLGKYDLCRALIGIRQELQVADDFERGRVSSEEGAYYAALSLHEYALIEYQEAIIAYEEALRRAPDDVASRNNKGNALQKLGSLQAALSQHEAARESYRQSVASYDEALGRAPDSIQIHNNKGNALESLGDLQAVLSEHKAALASYQNAIASYDEALRRDPDYVVAHISKGNGLQNLGALLASLSEYKEALVIYQRAIASFDELLRRAPHDAGAHNNKGVTLARIGDLKTALSEYEEAFANYQSAISSFDEALRLAPGYIDAHNSKGTALARIGDLQVARSKHKEALAIYRESIASFDEALRCAPDNVGAHNNKGIALGRLGALQATLSQHDASRNTHQEAIASFDKALDRAPDYVNAYNNRGNTLVSLGDLQTMLSEYEEALESYQNAITSYGEALHRAPDYVDAHNNKGNALQRLGDLWASLSRPEAAVESYVQSIASYNETMNRAPDYADAHNNKGNALTRLGDLQASLMQHKAALASYRNAVASFGEALDRAPNDVKVHNNKGNALERLGTLLASLSEHEAAAESYAQSSASYDEALDYAPDYVDAHNNKGIALQSLGALQTKQLRHEEAFTSYQNAIASYDKALGRAPDAAKVHNNKGNALLGLGELHASLSQHEEVLASYQSAIVSYGEALLRAPDYVGAHNNKGAALRSLGDLQASLSQNDAARESYLSAITSFSRSLEIAPAQENIRRLRDELQQMMGE